MEISAKILHLRRELQRLQVPKTYPDGLDSLQIIKKSCIRLIDGLTTKTDEKDIEAVLLFDKSIFNIETIFKLLESIQTKRYNSIPIEGISLVTRNILESYILFNNIFILTQMKRKIFYIVFG